MYDPHQANASCETLFLSLFSFDLNNSNCRNLAKPVSISVKEDDICFIYDCPATHPVKLPEINLFLIIENYSGGAHVFADGTDVSIKLLFKHKTRSRNVFGCANSYISDTL